MLTNKVPFGLLSDEEQELFRSELLSDLIAFDEKWDPAVKFSRIYNSIAYRLKLKEGKWYYSDDCTKNPQIRQYLGECSFGSYSKIFRPATQEELDSVKPKFKRGDVVGYCDNTNVFGRLGDPTKEGVFHGLSRVNSLSQFDFKVNRWIAEYDIIKATPDQIKQLKFEEMKNGKKWNGDGYDDYLIDGKTLNELTESDFENIEYNNHHEEWLPIQHSDLTEFIHHMTTIKDVDILVYRIKPQETQEQIRIKELEQELEDCYDRINGMHEFFEEQEKRAQEFCYNITKVGE